MLFLFNFHLQGQVKKNSVFKVGERIEYEVSYNWQFVWVSAGVVSFEVKMDEYNSKPVYFFEGIGSSNPSYDWFFKVRDKFISYVDTTTLLPYMGERTSSEGGYDVYEKYEFLSHGKKIISTVQATDKPRKVDTINVSFSVNDLLTAIYYMRTIDFSKCKLNEKIPLWVLVYGKTYPLYIRYLGNEAIETKNKEKVKCLKFSSKLVEGTIFKGGEDLFVWVTDDNNHIALKVQAKILVGSVIARLKDARNLKNPVPIK